MVFNDLIIGNSYVSMWQVSIRHSLVKYEEIGLFPPDFSKTLLVFLVEVCKPFVRIPFQLRNFIHWKEERTAMTPGCGVRVTAAAGQPGAGADPRPGAAVAALQVHGGPPTARLRGSGHAGASTRLCQVRAAAPEEPKGCSAGAFL